MTDFTIKVSLDVEAPFMFHRDAQRTHTIPPAYPLEDRRRLYAIRLEELTDDLFQGLGWFMPLRHALLANDARATEIERLANDSNTPLGQAILDVLNTPSQQAIDQWGTDPIEVDQPDI